MKSTTGPKNFTAVEWYEIAMSAGRDAANLRAHKCGRSVWTRGDYNHGCQTTARVLRMHPAYAEQPQAAA
jgi:hypothetical protein